MNATMQQPKRRSKLKMVRPISYGPWFKSHESDRHANCRWIENISDGLRVKAAHDVVNLKHTGWFIDYDFQHETIHGLVVQISGRDGKPQYFPGVSDAYNKDCGFVDFSESFESPQDCARCADSMAEIAAEKERDYQANERRKERIEELRGELKSCRSHVRTLKRIFASANKADKATIRAALKMACANGRRMLKEYRSLTN